MTGVRDENERRPFQFELTLFGSGREQVQVMASSRAVGFTAAALQAADPNNVWKVRLLRDSGRYLPEAEDLSDPDVPVVISEGEYSPRGFGRTIPSWRGYSVYFELFTLGADDEYVCVPGRPNVFSAGAIASRYPDRVMEVSIYLIVDDGGFEHEVDGRKMYGGVTVDMKDRFVPLRYSAPLRPSF